MLINLDGQFLVEENTICVSTADFRKASLFIDILKVKELKNRFPVFKVMEVEIVLRDVGLI